MALESPPINGAEIQRYSVVFGLFPGDPAFHTIVERAAEVGGSPGTPVEVATLAPGVRIFTETFRKDGFFVFYRFKHRGFGYDGGTPTAWFRARPVEWNGEIPNIPREALLDLDLALDDADGSVDIAVNGGRQVKSIEWDFTTSSFPTDPSTTVNTDAEGDVTVTDAFTLSAGQTGFVTVQFFDQVSGGGNLLGTLRASVTRPGEADPDTTLGTLVLNGDFEHDTDGAYWATLTSGGAVAIESGSPIHGTKSMKVTSHANASFIYQTTSSQGFTSAASNRRYIPVEPGDVLEATATGIGQSDQSIALKAVFWDEDKNLVGGGSPDLVGGFRTLATRTGQAEAPATARYMSLAVFVGTDASAPRDYFIDSITVRKIDGTDRGIPTEMSVGGIYYISDVEVIPDSSGGVEGSDPGFLYWGAADWRYIHPNGSKHFVLEDSVTLVSLDGTKANTAELLSYVGIDQSRFTGLADFHMRRIVGVRKSRSAGWQYLGDSGWLNFTPNTTDGLLAEPVLTSEVI